jgi:hypothetical protein
VPYYGIPWELLWRHRNWVIGDGFSGQFRLAASVLRPGTLTLLDDGTMTIALADALLERTGFTRPGQHESTLATLLGGLARNRMLRLATRERVEFSTAFTLGDDRMTALADRGIRVRPHSLEWVRRTAQPIVVPGNRVLLGSARPVDGLIPIDQYLAWVATEAKAGDLAYFPHRRETEKMLAVVARIPGVQVFDAGLPIELVLAGTREPLDVVTLRSSAATTLAHLLRGSDSVVRRASADTSVVGRSPVQ